MADKTDNLQLNDEQRTRLLGLGLEPAAPAIEPDADELRGDLLCDILRCPLPPNENGPRASKHLSQRFRSVLRPSLGQSLNDPETDVTVLKQIKEYAKARGRSAGSEVEKEVFLAVYFAAIARALTLRGEGITRHSDEDLVQFFNAYARTGWMRFDLRELFAKAAEDCELNQRGRTGPSY